MQKKTLLIVLAVASLAAYQLSFNGQNVNPRNNHNRPSNQHKADFVKLSPGSTERNNGLSLSNPATIANSDRIINGQLSVTLDYLLVSDKLSDFPEAELSKITNLCQNKHHQGSDTACKVFQHWNELVSKQALESGQMEAIWLETEKNAGTALEENIEITPLVEKQITQASGGETDNLESVLQNLEDRALNDPSPDERHQAIQDIVSMKAPSLIPVLENAMSDESPANRELADEGLSQLREMDQKAVMSNTENPGQKSTSGVPHYSLADVSSR